MTRPLRLVFKLSVSAALVGYALSTADLSATAGLFPALKWLPLLLMLVTNFLTRLIAAFRWYRLVGPVLPDAGYSDFVRLTLASSFYGQFLPGGGVEALQVAGLSRVRSDLPVAVASVFTDRLFGLLSLTLLLAVGVALSGPAVASPVAAAGLTAALTSAMAIACLFNAGCRARLASAVNRLAARHKRLMPLTAPLAYFDTLSGRPALLVESLLLALLMQLLRVAVYFLGALALGTCLPLPALMLSIPSILLLLVLPVSVGGIGIRESSLVFFFAMFGFGAELGLALALLVYVSNIVVSIPGAWFGLGAMAARIRG